MKEERNKLNRRTDFYQVPLSTCPNLQIAEVRDAAPEDEDEGEGVDEEDENDDRPALILEHCEGVSIGGEVQLERGRGVSYDVGLRDSRSIALPQHLRSCQYPHCDF